MSAPFFFFVFVFVFWGFRSPAQFFIFRLFFLKGVQVRGGGVEQCADRPCPETPSPQPPSAVVIRSGPALLSRADLRAERRAAVAHLLVSLRALDRAHHAAHRGERGHLRGGVLLVAPISLLSFFLSLKGCVCAPNFSLYVCKYENIKKNSCRLVRNLQVLFLILIFSFTRVWAQRRFVQCENGAPAHHECEQSPRRSPICSGTSRPAKDRGT